MRSATGPQSSSVPRAWQSRIAAATALRQPRNRTPNKDQRREPASQRMRTRLESAMECWQQAHFPSGCSSSPD
jgi:hypothetical protein